MAAMQPSTASKGVKIEGRTGATPHLRQERSSSSMVAGGMFQAKEGWHHEKERKKTWVKSGTTTKNTRDFQIYGSN